MVDVDADQLLGEAQMMTEGFANVCKHTRTRGSDLGADAVAGKNCDQGVQDLCTSKLPI